MIERQKSTEVEHPVSELIKNRRSTRVFTSEMVDESKIRSLFEATRWAPSSTNEQPWIYLFATKDQPELWNKMIKALTPSNLEWVKDAPLIILSIARKAFVRNGKPNAYAMYDLGGANGILSLQAVELGLQVRQIAGFDGDIARAELNIPQDFELGVFMAVGFPGNPEQLPEPIKVKELAPRTRFLQQEFVRNEVF